MFNPPKNIKYKKLRKGKLKEFDFKSNSLKFGTIGLKAIEAGIVSSKQIESARQAIVRKIKRKGKIWIRIFPDIPITSKSTGIRMGKGKGQINYWGSKIKGGTVLFEICGVSFDLVKAALKTGGAKLPIRTKIFI